MEDIILQKVTLTQYYIINFIIFKNHRMVRFMLRITSKIILLISLIKIKILLKYS